MPLHLDPITADPAAHKSLYSVSGYTKSSEIDAKLQHLIAIRTSQINRCAFCLDMHILEARKDGETAQKIDLLAAWREAPCYEPAERVALELTEYVTLISEAGVPDELDAELRKFYSEMQIVQLLMTIISTNSWNRLIASTTKQPAKR